MGKRSLYWSFGYASKRKSRRTKATKLMSEDSKLSGVIQKNKQDNRTSSASKEELFQQIRDILNLTKNQRAGGESSTRIMESFVSSIEKNNAELLKEITKEDKKLLEDILDKITKLQFQTLDKFKESLADINKVLTELASKSETGSSPKLKEIAEQLQEAILQERFKAEGLTLEGADDTFVNRLKKELGITSKEPGQEGKPVQGFKESIKVGFSEFFAGFKEGFGPRKGGVGDRIYRSQESRREEIRRESERTNDLNTKIETLKKQFSEVLNTQKQPKEENTGESVSTNAPDNDNSKEVGGKIETSSANESAKNIEGVTRSARDEERAGITDADSQFARSGTVSDVEDNWNKLLAILEEIRDCVCECQCGNSGTGENLPLPSPVSPKVRTAEPTAAPQAESTGIGTGIKTALGATAAGAVALLARRPQLAAKVGRLFSRSGNTAVAAKSATRPLTLSSPASMAASGSGTQRLALPAPSAANRSGISLEQLGLKTGTREKVLASRPTPSTPATKTIAQRFYDGELTAKEAVARQREFNRNLPAEQRTRLPATANTAVKENITNRNLTANSNFLETSRRLTREEYIGKLRATETENQLLRNIKTDQAQANAPLARANASEAKLARTIRSDVRTGGITMGGAASTAPKAAKAGGILSKIGRGGSKILGPIGAALDFGSRKAEGQGTAKAAIGTAGGLAGAAGGAVIGQALIPIPVLGALIGGVAGGLLGGSVADKATDFMGMRESGGPVSPDGSYIVGEKGPEIFTPNTAGSITNNMNSKSLVETGQNNISSSINQITNEAKENTAPVINVPPPTVIPQPIPAGGGGNNIMSGPLDTVRTEDSSWQRFQNRRAFG